MPFTEDQSVLLSEPLDPKAIKQISRGGRNADYISGFTAISAANRIFGFDGWNSDLVDIHCVESSQQENQNYAGRDNKRGYLVAYTARVRVTIGEQSHEDIGYGEGIDYTNVGQAHESAVKEAVTDALKRALRHWGDQFGLSLYDKDRDRTESPPAPSQAASKPAPKLTSKQVERLFAIAGKHGVTDAQIKTAVSKYGHQHTNELSAAQYDDLVARIEAKSPGTGAAQAEDA